MLDDILGYIGGITFKDWGGPVMAAVIALSGVWYTQRSKVRLTRERDARDTERLQREAAERAKTGDRTFDIAATHDLTVRFKALMDGYEARILDLTNELRATKVELREARMEIIQLRERLDAG